jgi:hypothetical protein
MVKLYLPDTKNPNTYNYSLPTVLCGYEICYFTMKVDLIKERGGEYLGLKKE